MGFGGGMGEGMEKVLRAYQRAQKPGARGEKYPVTWDASSAGPVAATRTDVKLEIVRAGPYATTLPRQHDQVFRLAIALLYASFYVFVVAAPL